MCTAVSRTVIASCAILVVGAGCWRPPLPTRDEQQQGYILLLQGIDYTAWQMADTYRGLRDAGIRGAIDVPDWGYRNSFGAAGRNIKELEHNRDLAAGYARQIADYQKAFPGRPTCIIGYSGGAAIGVFAAEVLAPGVQIDRMILLGAALSPDYDLSRALSRCDRGIVNLYSAEDSLVLGALTKKYGTMDRKYVASAGHVGFTRPATASQPALYAKLTQVAWTPEMRAQGHDGGHFGWLARRWAAEVVAPYVKQ